MCNWLFQMAVNMAFEKLAGVEVPRRALWLRSLLAELQRIASHLIALVAMAGPAGPMLLPLDAAGPDDGAAPVQRVGQHVACSVDHDLARGVVERVQVSAQPERPDVRLRVRRIVLGACVGVNGVIRQR